MKRLEQNKFPLGVIIGCVLGIWAMTISEGPTTPPTTCSEMAIVCSQAGLGIENAMNVLLSGGLE